MSATDSPAWLSTLRRYVVLGLLLNVCWEILQLPLYTIWATGTTGAIFFALLHCTAGDVIISVCSLVLSLLLAGKKEWPNNRFKAIALITMVLGLGYTFTANGTTRRSPKVGLILKPCPACGA